MTDEQLKWMMHIPKSYRKNYEKAMTTNSRKEKIKAKCLDCNCWIIKEIRGCQIETCPLWTDRPYKP